jgi:hypothetical protein
VTWLNVLRTHGNISSPTVQLPLVVDASGLPDRFDERYEVVLHAALNRRGLVTEQLLIMPVRIIVSARVAIGKCTVANTSHASPIVGQRTSFVFTACDVDGLPLQTPSAGFEPVLMIDDCVLSPCSLSANGLRPSGLIADDARPSMSYRGGANGGEYLVQLWPPRRSVFTLSFLYNGMLVPRTNVSFVTTCPADEAHR